MCVLFALCSLRNLAYFKYIMFFLCVFLLLCLLVGSQSLLELKALSLCAVTAFVQILQQILILIHV